MARGKTIEQLKLEISRQELKKLLETETTIEICDKLNTTRSTLYKLRKAYELPIKKYFRVFI